MSVLSVLACRLRPRANAVSAGSARCTMIPAAASSSAMYRPPGARLHRERDILAAREPRQPGPLVHPVGRADLAAPHLPDLGVEVVVQTIS